MGMVTDFSAVRDPCDLDRTIEDGCVLSKEMVNEVPGNMMNTEQRARYGTCAEESRVRLNSFALVCVLH